MTQSNDLARLRQEYAGRQQRLAGCDVYSWSNPAALFEVHQRQRAILKALRAHGFADLARLRLLEMGCGRGGVLAEFLNFGMLPRKMHGVDLLFDRLEQARER